LFLRTTPLKKGLQS